MLWVEKEQLQLRFGPLRRFSYRASLREVCLDGSRSDMAQTGETTERWIARAVGRECREKAGNVYMASFFLPPRKRLAVQAVGVFIEMLEEAMDVAGAGAGGSGGACTSGSDLEGRLGMVKERLERTYGGE